MTVGAFSLTIFFAFQKFAERGLNKIFLRYLLCSNGTYKKIGSFRLTDTSLSFHHFRSVSTNYFQVELLSVPYNHIGTSEYRFYIRGRYKPFVPALVLYQAYNERILELSLRPYYFRKITISFGAVLFPPKYHQSEYPILKKGTTNFTPSLIGVYPAL